MMQLISDDHEMIGCSEADSPGVGTTVEKTVVEKKEKMVVAVACYERADSRRAGVSE